MFCLHCGKEIPDQSTFCMVCGKTIKPIQGRPLSWPLIAGVAAAFLIGVGLTVVVTKRASYKSPAAIVDVPSTATQPSNRPSPLEKSPGQIEPAPVKLSPADIAAKFSGAVVVLESYNDQGQKSALGSGFISSPDGKVFTNYHVIRGASRMLARMHDQSTCDVQYIAGYDVAHDVAALKIAGSGLISVHLGNSSLVKAGDHVTALGAPMGLESTLSDGIISAVREIGSFRIFQTSAPISHGSSGGPVFDDYGNVVALAVATIETGENLNFAVPIDTAKALLRDEHQTSFVELLAMTAVHQPILSSSLSVPPQVVTLDLVVPPQGGLLAGSFSISGGLGNDLGVSVVSANGGLAWNGGVIQRYCNLRIPLRGGRYKLVLNNHVGPLWTSSKTISGTVELSYYR